MDETVLLRLHKDEDLRYGENPHQKAAWYFPFLSLPPEISQGKALSYTNILDLDAALRIAGNFTEPAAAIVKHTNPCGVAVSGNVRDAYITARNADPLSAFGGIVGLNRPLDAATASVICETFIECLIAPVVLEEAKPILAAKKNMRVVLADTSHLEFLDVRSALGGYLVQERDLIPEGQPEWGPENASLRVVTKRQPSSREWRALRFACIVCAFVKSNSVIFTLEDRTLAIGAGQTSRVDAVKVARLKAANPKQPADLRGSVAASDAFFPFRDGLDEVAEAGATAVVQPGGSTRDDEVIAAADEHGLAMVFTDRRHFRN